MDKKDKKILDILQKDGRITNERLSEIMKLSPPSVLERVKKLEKSKIIQGYKAILDREKIGRPILAFISILLEKNDRKSINELFEHLHHTEEVLEIYQVTGRFDFLVKVTAKNLEDLNHIISDKISPTSLIKKVETFLILKSIEDGIYPLDY